MKQPKKLTRKQKECVSAHYLNPDDWVFLEEAEFYYIIMRKDSGQKKWIDKFRREKTRCGKHR